MRQMMSIAALLGVLLVTPAAFGQIVLPPSLGQAVQKGAQNATDRTLNERLKPPQGKPQPDDERAETPQKPPSPKKPRSK